MPGFGPTMTPLEERDEPDAIGCPPALSFGERLAWALCILVVDAVTVFVPLCALLAAYLMLARPAWFREWVLKVYGDPAAGR